jgi:hypothetical protein
MTFALFQGQHRCRVLGLDNERRRDKTQAFCLQALAFQRRNVICLYKESVRTAL